MRSLFLIVLLGSVMAHGSGYEKAILWGAKYSGVAGVGSPGVKGSDSVFYNPAGLVNSSEFGEFVFNLSQSSSTAKGPVVPTLAPGPGATVFTNAEKQETATNAGSLIPGVTYSMKLSDSLAFGLGYYAVGGTRAKYEDVDFAPRNFKAKVGSEISITEFAAGVGYKVNEAFRLGMSLRYTMTEAAFSAVSYRLVQSPNIYGIVNLDIKDVKYAALDSVRLGAQYDVSESLKLGLMIRTETAVDGKAKASGRLNTPASTSSIAEVDAKVKTVLPMAVGLGAEFKLSDTWNLFGEYVMTQYSKIDKVVVDGTITLGSNNSEITDIEQKWKDQHQLKLAGEYSGISWPVRFGYIWTSQVSNSDYARASFTPPGAAATYTLGTGQEFKVGENPLELNLAVDYTTVSGSSSDTPASSLASPKGTYEVTALGIHTGLVYKF